MTALPPPIQTMEELDVVECSEPLVVHHFVGRPIFDGMFSPAEQKALREIIKHFSVPFHAGTHWEDLEAACKAALPAPDSAKLPVVDTGAK